MERLSPPARPRVMQLSVTTVVLAATVLLAGCGQDDDPTTVGTTSAQACPTSRAGSTVVTRADLDGDGTAEDVEYVPATGSCGPLLTAQVAGENGSSPLDDDLAPAPHDSFAISVPGRTGDVAVVVQKHPRGGFQVVLFGWSAGAGVSTFNIDDHPVFPFVATDVEPSPITARCVQDGIEIDQGRRHQPIGVVPAWDIVRTTYTLNGTSTTAGPTKEIADNVLEKQLRTHDRDLVDHALFENCRVAS